MPQHVCHHPSVHPGRSVERTGTRERTCVHCGVTGAHAELLVRDDVPWLKRVLGRRDRRVRRYLVCEACQTRVRAR